MAARTLAAVLVLLINILIARVYGAEALGILAIINSFILFAVLFAVLGLDTAILRLIPEHLVKHSTMSAYLVYRKSLSIIVCLSIVASTAVYLCAPVIAGSIFSKPQMASCFMLVALFLVFRSLMQFNTQAIRGLRLIRMFALMFVMPHLFNLALLLVLSFFIHSQHVPVYALLGSFALTGIVGWMVMEYRFRQIINPGDQVRTMPYKEIISLSLPMVMTSAMTVIIGQTGIIMLGVFRPEHEAGYYSVAVNLATLTTFVLTAINSMSAPKFSELFHSGRLDELFQVARKATRLIFWTTCPILLFLAAFGNPLLSLLFGHDYTIVYGAMLLLVIGQFVNSISGSTGIFMNMTGNQKAFRNIIASAAGINILLNLLLTPSIGFTGAALSGMISLIFWNFGALLFMKLKYGQTIIYIPLLQGIKSDHKL